MPDRQLIAWIEEGLAGEERYTLHEILAGIASGHYQLWRCPQGICITTLDGPSVVVFLLAGRDFDEWKERGMNDLIAFARLSGKQFVEAHCRPGMAKKLEELGWKRKQIIMRMRI